MRSPSLILCSNPRSGSTLLCDLLAATGVCGRPASFYRAQSIDESAERFGMSAYDHPTPESFERAYLAGVIGTGSDASGRFALRLMAENRPQLAARLGLIHPNCKSDAERFAAVHRGGGGVADGQQVRQILHNLVQNAQDAMAGVPNAQVVLRTRRSDSGQWVRLSVLDQGPGFAEHILKRAFEPYVTTKTKGTGLGLAVVKKIMDEHGGRIDVSNRVTDGKVVGAQVSLSFAVAN